MRILRKILLPFSLLYGVITWTRNRLFDAGLLKSKSYDIPVICVGNLSTGGTGKSPMIEYLLNLLLKDHRVATLSRGYKRKEKGFKLLKGTETAREVGDEPLQFKLKFRDALVAVDENRQEGIARLLEKNAEVILLDDALQHRKVEAGLNVLLTAYGSLYVSDFVLPAGNLRESESGAERAKIIVVTKCPPKLTKGEQLRIKNKLRLRNYQKLYFSYVQYDDKLRSKNSVEDWGEFKEKEFVVVTGIANPKPFVEHVRKMKPGVTHVKFPDHHNFTQAEIERIAKYPYILTTEKDFMRLKNRIAPEKLFYVSIKTAFLKGKEKFDSQIEQFVNEK